MRLRNPIVDLRRVLNAHMVAGGPSADTGRLDYLVRWAEATGRSTTAPSPTRSPRRRTRPGRACRTRTRTPSTPRCGDRVATPRRTAGSSRRRSTTRSTSSSAPSPCSIGARTRSCGTCTARSKPTRRRSGAAGSRCEASDLVRFSRTYRSWRNAQVDMLDADGACDAQLRALADFEVADDLAQDPGTRPVAVATVASTVPFRLEIASRRFVDGTTIVALHINRQAARGAPADDAEDPEDELQVRADAARPDPHGRERHPRLGAAGRPDRCRSAIA